MKKVLIVIIILSTCLPGFGQEFHFHSINPFGIRPINEDSTQSAQKLMWFDYDQDADLDLIMTGIDSLGEGLESWEDFYYFIQWQENIGDKWNPQFSDRMPLPGNFPFPLGYFFPTIGDLNDDKHPDFIIFGLVDHIGNRTPTYVSSMGPGQGFEMTRFDEMGLPDFVPESFFIPELLDLDVDGDLDLLMSGFDPAFAEEDGADVPTYYYAKNIGTPANPEFLGWYDNPYGLMPNPLTEILIGGDIDNDGDADLIGPALLIPPDSINYLYVHLNNPGVDGKPAFSTVLESPFGLPMTFGEAQLLFPNLVDIDGDGDLDLFVFEGTQNGQILKYFENSLCIGIITEMIVELCEGDAIIVAGNTYTTAGNFTISLESAEGCDSTILLTIELLPTFTVSLNESICQGESLVVGNESFTDEGFYTVSLVAANGCDSTINLSLEVQPTYSVPVNETICAGESFVIGNETFTQPGDYTVFMLAANGCDSIILLSLEVHAVDNSITVQENTLTANEPFVSYQWFNCDTGENIPGATNQTYVVLTTGNYAVSLLDGFGCTAVSACNFIIISATEEERISNAISLYPNPSDSWVHILNETQHPVSKLTLINTSGQTINEIVPIGNSMDISHLEQGIYFVKLKINGLDIMKKLIVL
jgi:hypothetical protein